MGAQVRPDTEAPDVSDVDSAEDTPKRKLSFCCKDGIVSTHLSPTVLDSYRGDLLAALPFAGSPNAFKSIDECKHSLFLSAGEAYDADIQIQRREDLVLKVSPDVAHPVVSVVFPLSIQDPCVYRCFLVGAQSLYEFRRASGPPERSSLVIDLQGKAILALQKRLSKPSAHLDDGVLFSVLHLMIAAVSRE
jgi:hypothetical protein